MALASIIFGIALLVVASGLIAGMLKDYREATIRAQFGHVQIVKPGYYESGQADPLAYLLPDPARWPSGTYQHVSNLGATPRIGFNGLISKGEATVSMLAEGIDPAGEPHDGKGIRLLQGSPLTRADAREVMLGVGLARILSAKPGDSVVLLANTGRGGINAVEVRVTGLFTSVSSDYDNVALRVPVQTARDLLRIKGSHQWLIFLADTNATDSVAERLRSILPAAKFEVTPWYKLAEFYNRASDLLWQQLSVVKIIIAAIIVLGISNTLTMSVLERTTEIGTCLALGNRRREILRQFMLEGLLLGLVGGMLGVGLGFVINAVISALAIPMPPPPGMAQGYIAHSILTSGIASEAMFLAIAATVLASIFPAWRASRLNIVDALRMAR